MIKELPTTVTLDADDAKALRDLNDKIKGVQGWVTAVSQQGERRMAELAAEGREQWGKLQAKYKLDLKNVNYDLNEDGTLLVPQTARLV